MLDIGLIVKIFVGLVLIFYIFWAIMLFLRVRILSDTIHTGFNGVVKFLTVMHTFLAITGALVLMAFIILI
ncbi:hypothetical protein GF357_00620 [Candidatus Dojkabacteria bacterium]|nr:hypothetical protein [Candidatus Dojkabacteria bacterium]